MIATGRDAEIVDVGRGRVLRRYLTPRSPGTEPVVMRLVREAGYPVPEVFEVHDTGMVMERVDGVTMLDDVAAHPWRIYRHARTLAALHLALHRIAPAEGLPAPFGDPAPGDSVVHGDLHPANVIMSPAGPVVIDWSGAGRGAGAADVADTWLVLASARPPGGLLTRFLAVVLRRRFLAAFLREAGRSEAAKHLQRAAARRAADPHLTAAEKAALRRLASGQGTG